MAGELFNVAATLLVLSVPTVLVTNLTGSGLRMEWTVEKTRTGAPDTATITVYNLAKVLRESLKNSAKIPGPVFVNLAIGWDGLTELVFSGQAWKMTAEKKLPNDTVSIIVAGDGTAELRDTPPAGGVAVGSVVALAIEKRALALGFAVSAAARAEIVAAAALIPVQTFQDVSDLDARDQLDSLMASIGLTWSIVGNRFVVYRGGVRSDARYTILAPVSGLLGWEETDDGGVAFEALAQASTEPGGLISALDAYNAPIGGGPTVVETVTFTGSTDGPSLMRGIARRVTAVA